MKDYTTVYYTTDGSQTNELIPDCTGGLMTRQGCSVAWNADRYRGEKF
jgi:hypothetical protein